MMCISVDLPEPEGPMIATIFTGRDRQRDAAQGLDRQAAAGVGLADCFQRNDRRRDVAVVLRVVRQDRHPPNLPPPNLPPPNLPPPPSPPPPNPPRVPVPAPVRAVPEVRRVTGTTMV